MNQALVLVVDDEEKEDRISALEAGADDFLSKLRCSGSNGTMTN